METEIEVDVAQATETYYNLIEFNKVNGFCEGHPCAVFTGKLHEFLTERGVELK